VELDPRVEKGPFGAGVRAGPETVSTKGSV
jgi:hypothetical protein